MGHIMIVGKLISRNVLNKTYIEHTLKKTKVFYLKIKPYHFIISS